MELVAKFYPHYWSTALIMQEPIITQVVIDEDLKTFDVVDFDVPLFTGIARDVKVELYEVNINTDKKVFSWYIHEIKPKRKQFNMIWLQARSEKAIMNKRLALQVYNITNQDIKVAVQTLLAQYNTSFGDSWTVETDFTANIPELKVEIEDEYFGIFDELAESTDSFWTVKDGVVRFSKNSGQDKTTSAIVDFDGQSPNPWNIDDIEVKETATSASIVIVNEINGTKNVDTSKYADFCLGVATKTIRKWDIVEKTAKFYENINKPQRSYNISIVNNSIDVNTGDLIQVNVYNTNDFYDYEWPATIITKKTTYSNATKKIEYCVWEFIVAPFTMESRLNGVEKQIKLLKLK